MRSNDDIGTMHVPANGAESCGNVSVRLVRRRSTEVLELMLDSGPRHLRLILDEPSAYRRLQRALPITNEGDRGVHSGDEYSPVRYRDLPTLMIGKHRRHQPRRNERNGLFTVPRTQRAGNDSEPLQKCAAGNRW